MWRHNSRKVILQILLRWWLIVNGTTEEKKTFEMIFGTCCNLLFILFHWVRVNNIKFWLKTTFLHIFTVKTLPPKSPDDFDERIHNPNFAWKHKRFESKFYNIEHVFLRFPNCVNNFRSISPQHVNLECERNGFYDHHWFWYVTIIFFLVKIFLLFLKIIMVIGFIFAWLPGTFYTAFKFKYAEELKDLQWGNGKWEFWIRKTHNILGFIYGFSLYRNVFYSR